MALIQTFNRTCTNYYYYSNTFTCNDKSCNQTNSGYSNHSDYSDHYDSCSNSGYNDHSQSCSDYSGGCSDHTNTGCMNHSDSHSDYDDHSDSGCSNYSNYTNYQNGYYCSTYKNYTNYIDASQPRLGGPVTLKWSYSIDKDAKITSSAIKEIRDKVRQLSTGKQRNQVSDTNISPGSGNASDSLTGPYKRSMLSTVNGIRDTLNSLYSELGKSNSNNPSFSWLQNSTISSLKTAINTLAAEDLSSKYVNYVNSSYDYNNQNTYSNMSNIPVNKITYYGNAGSYINSYCSEYKNS